MSVTHETALELAEPALNLYSRRVEAGDRDAVAVGELLAAHASLAGAAATAYCSSRSSRAVIEPAKGVLMAQRGGTPDEAFAVLVELSQRGNRQLRDVAQALVDAPRGD